MSVSYYPQPVPPRPARPWGRILAIGISIGFVISLAIIALAARISYHQDPTTAYIDKVSVQLEEWPGAPADDAQQAFIDAGRELCEVGIDGVRLDQGAEARAILAKHSLGTPYQDSWPLIAGAADQYLC